MRCGLKFTDGVVCEWAVIEAVSFGQWEFKESFVVVVTEFKAAWSVSFVADLPPAGEVR